VTGREQFATNVVHCHPGLDPDQAMQCVLAGIDSNGSDGYKWRPADV
jgi:hypothetical protein